MKKTLSDSSRDPYYDNLRLFLIFIVVLCHGLETARSASTLIKSIHNVLLCFVMPLFVFISGYFAKGMAKADNPKRNRILNIVLMYVLIQTIKMVITGKLNFLYPTYGNWYLICLAMWYTVLPLVCNIKPVVLMTLSIIAALLIGAESGGITVLQVTRAVCFFPFFMLGFYMNKEQMEFIKKPAVRAAGTTILAGMILFILNVWCKVVPLNIMHANKTYEQMKLSILSGFSMRFGWYIVAVIMSFAVMCVIPRRQFRFTVIGSRTLPIYIIHTCLYHFLSKRTEFFTIMKSISNRYLRIIAFFMLPLVVTLVCGNRYFAQAFNKIMQYDFHHFLKQDTEQSMKL